MPRLTLTPEDYLRGKLITPPGWYDFFVKSVTEEPAGTDGSTNILVDLVCASEGPNNGVPVRRIFNEKSPGFAIPYIKAFGVATDDKATQTFELADTQGKYVCANVGHREYQKKMQNDVLDFRPSTRK